MARQPTFAVLQPRTSSKCCLRAKASLSLYCRFVQAASAGGRCEGGHEAAPNSPHGDCQVTHCSLAGYYANYDSTRMLYYAGMQWLNGSELVRECVRVHQEVDQT